MISKVKNYKCSYYYSRYKKANKCNLLYKNPIVGRYCILFSGWIEDIPSNYLDLDVDSGYIKNNILCLKVVM